MVTRAFGDFKFKFTNEFKILDYKTLLVTPEVREHRIDPFNDEFVVIASDGLFDEMLSQEVVEFVLDRFNEKPDNILKALMDKLFEDREGKDDITVILVMLQRNY